MSDAANRVLWTLIGVLLLAVGIAIGLMHFGRMPGVSSDSVLLSDGLLDLWHRGDDWNVAVLVAVGAVVTVLGLWLFGRQFRRRSGPGLANLLSRGDDDEVRWRTHVKSGALVRALERDLVDKRIVGAHVVMTGRPPRPDAWVRLDLAPGVALADVNERVRRSVERFSTTTGLQPATVEVTVRPSRRTASRVRLAGRHPFVDAFGAESVVDDHDPGSDGAAAFPGTGLDDSQMLGRQRQ